MKVISKTRVTHTETEVVSLQAAMRRIGSEEFKPVIDEIKRRAGSKEVGHIKVSDLPAIYPCITHTTDMSTGSLLDENNIIPTGLVQFDFDWKDDHYSVVEKESIISEIKGKIKQWPEVVYLFDSPSGGLKFAVMTDLKKGSTEKFKEINSRFKMAYYNLQERYSKELDIEFDGAMAKLKQALFLSYDPDFYYNKNFESIKVNDWTNLEAERKKKEEQRRLPSYSGRYSDNFMVNILSFIPSDLSYDESLKVSYAVSGLLGEQAVNVLSRHWKKDSDKSNRIKLKSVTPSEVYDYLSALIGFARKYVSQNNSSELEALINNHAGINLQTAVPVKQELPPLLTPEQGKLELDQAISEFFSVGSSMCIKASGGLGKTDAVLKAIGQMPEDKKILFLVKTHKNSEEIINRFKLLFGCSKKISLSQGKVRSCNNNEVKEFYESNGIPIPTYECLYNCPLKDGCDYILSRRFDDQIRVMTHDELYSPASIWTYGYTSDPLKAKQLSLPVSGLKPRAMGWKPDFIVVDENHLRLDPVEASYSDQWNSPAEILHKLRKGMDLKQAIASSHNEIMDDQITLTALEERKIKFLNRNDFVSQAKNHNNRIKAAPLIKFLGSIMLDGDGELGRLQARGEKSLLTLYRMKELAIRYKNVPTLYLDATAIEAVVKSQVDHLIFREICVKKSPNVVTKMYSNVNFSRQKINEPGGVEKILKVVKPHIKDPNSTFIITYKTVGRHNSFHHDLADALNVPRENVGYFGNERGLNAFENAKSLFIIGRHWLPSNVYNGYYRAIFVDDPMGERIYADKVVRMTNNQHQSVKSSDFVNENYRMVHEHFAQSETVQAFLRGRLIYGSPKEIIFFGSNPLGHEIEIDEILFSDAHFGLTDYIQPLKAKGFVRVKYSELKKYGVTEHYFKMHRGDICRTLQRYGGEIRTVTLKGKNGRTNVWEFSIFDFELFERWLERKNFMLISCSSSDRPMDSIIE